MKKFIALLVAALLLLSTAAFASDRYDLDDFGYRTVKTRGTFMNDHRFYDGDEIFVNRDYRESGYALAYDNGSYGYVDARYIDWDDDDDDDDDDDYDGDDVHDLDNFEYRYVDIDNGGALVFQRTPRGEFLYKYKFYDGDRIFVNVDYRERGYALAYKNGVYGYVDAGYIDW